MFIPKLHNRIELSLFQMTRVYLIGPAFIFLVGWFDFRFSLIGLLATLGAILYDKRFIKGKENSFLPLGYKNYLFTGSLALIWVFLSGVGGFAYQNSDFFKHNAILSDLITSSWPVTYGGSGFLSYTIGYYLPAALIGKIFGWAIANCFHFLWTSLGVFLVLLWVIRLVPKAPVVMLCLTFMGLGGLDFLGYYFVTGALPTFGDHVEWWSKYFQYSANSTLLFWVPHHALSSWMLAALIFLKIKEKYEWRALDFVFFSAVLVWSPFSFVGLFLTLLSVVIAYSKDFPEVIMTIKGWIYICRWRVLFSLPLVLFFVSYILSNQFKLEMLYFWQIGPLAEVVMRFFLFCVVEFGLYGIITHYLSDDGPERKMIRVILFVLVALAFLKLGAANDLMMRASIPVFFLFWIAVLRNLFGGTKKMRFTHGLLIALISIGALTGTSEIWRSISKVSYHRSHEINVQLLTKDPFAEQYMGRYDSFFWKVLSRTEELNNPQ